MAKDMKQSLYNLVVNRHKHGEISINVDEGSSLRSYASLSGNPLIKLFHSIMYLCSHPLTIICAVIFFVVMRQFIYILYFGVGLAAFISIENHVMRRVTISAALKNKSVFDELYKGGIIKIKEIFDRHHPV